MTTSAESHAEQVAQLEAVRIRMRDLARLYPWFAEALSRGFADYVALIVRFGQQTAALRDREKELARALLASGRLIDPQCRRGAPGVDVEMLGRLPHELIERHKQYPSPLDYPPDLESAIASALAKSDRTVTYSEIGSARAPQAQRECTPSAPEAEGGGEDCRWLVTIVRPTDWQQPVYPGTSKRRELALFPDNELLTIALYRLGGLADTGLIHPIVRMPSVENVPDPMPVFGAWRFRYPVLDAERELDDPPLHPPAFPPHIAKQMLERVERWVSAQLAKREPATRQQEPAVIDGQAMDADDARAVRLLAERPVWAMDELPEGIDADSLRILDAKRLIHARAVIMKNPQQLWNGPVPTFVPTPQHWYSPIEHPTYMGDWGVIFAERRRDKHHHPSEIQVNDRGRAALAAWERQRARASAEQSTGAPAGVARSASAGESPSNADDADYRPVQEFPSKMHARLRQAILPNRKTKRVRSTEIDGVTLYSFTDAHRWWRRDFPKNA